MAVDDLGTVMNLAGDADRSVWWYGAGVGLCVGVVWATASLDVRHSAAAAEFHNIGWAYVTLVISVLSLLYPLALTLRESLTGRVYRAFDQLREAIGPEAPTDHPALLTFQEETFLPVQRFRRWVFGRQLPLLATFSISSAVRVLLCMMGIGPLSVLQQMLEPQAFVLIYLGWMATMIVTIGKTQPFRAVERGESRARSMAPIERKPSEASTTILTPPAGNQPPLGQRSPRRRRRRRRS